MIEFNDATRAQVDAANPQNSTWVSANAGSGKTRVLTDRVARLLLHGSDPQKILCLTYTNAAAAEMQNRLFKRLGEWAMLPDKDLRQTLLELGETHSDLTDQKLRHARTLFAGALETPGGLKIQTIHSFCDALLRQFPLEAQVSPQFEILDDRLAKQVRSEILDEMADGADRPHLEKLATFYTKMELDGLLFGIAQNHRHFKHIPNPADFGIDPKCSEQNIAEITITDADISVMKDWIPILHAGTTKSDPKFGALFQSLVDQSDKLSILNALKENVLTQQFKVSSRAAPSAKLRTANPEIADRISDFYERVERAHFTLAALTTYQRAVALFNFAKPFIDKYQSYKLTSGKLDYQDLIEKAGDLLKHNSMSQWVLFRLDGGIDHVLVDEAQDTSPDQWSLIRSLTEEFTSGVGRTETQRTIFVVGDEKQSIYSFQGADPKHFGQMQNWFDERLSVIEHRLHSRDLLFSFRSADPILRLVDATFVGEAKSGIIGDVQHRAFQTEKPGRVELWPVIEPPEKPEDLPWYTPLDRPNQSDPKLVLAAKIANWVKDTIASGKLLDGEDGPAPIHEGDFLILVRKRGALFRAIIKNLKAQGLNVAGADRLNVGDELAVKDILSLLKFAATPEDDLSLAEALRSPILNISEGELFTLAHGRKATLWQSFREQSDSFATAYEIVTDILNVSDWMRPFEVINRILTKHKARENLLDRLGEEAEDGIDELLSQAMKYEQVEPPTLTGFLDWFTSGKVEIKREMDSTAGQVRVMTVHASKGLEAPIVILPDTVSSRSPDNDELVQLDENIMGLKTSANAKGLKEREQDEAKKEHQAQENLRLLYVAITRAESWLVVCGAGKIEKTPPWYTIVENGMINAGAVKQDDNLVLQTEHWLADGSDVKQSSNTTDTALPAWLLQPAPTPEPRVKTLSPSKMDGAKALPTEHQEFDEIAAMRLGSFIHLLLEKLPDLPSEKWHSFAHKMLKGADKKITFTETETIYEHASAVLENPNLRHVFSPDSLAEVPIVAKVPALENQTIYGTIDRLIVTPNQVHVVDFKSNLRVPYTPKQVPVGILRQLGVYFHAVRAIYPDHDIELSILWTQDQQLMSIPHNMVIEALKTHTTS